MNNEKCYGAIDIGSNAVRLLIKRLVTDPATGLQVLNKELLLRYPLRLGFDVFSEGKISREKGRNLQRLMQAYRNLMDIYGVDQYRACATSAMRDSKNGQKLIKKIKKTADIKIDIIDGQEEARIVYDNHLECLEDRTGNYMYVDVGGGSTEVNLLVDGELVYSKSFNIGTIRILTGGVTEGAWQRMKDEIVDHTRQFGTINIIGSGGNINKLYKLIDEKDKTRKRISIKSLQEIYDQLAPLTPEERSEKFGLRTDRADVIEPAGRIFLTLAEAIRAQYIYVPVIGIADGIIDSLLSEDIEKAERKAQKNARKQAKAAEKSDEEEKDGTDAQADNGPTSSEEPVTTPAADAQRTADAEPAQVDAPDEREDTDNEATPAKPD